MKTKTNLSSLGERGFLKRILPPLSRGAGSAFLVPPGDDAAVMRATKAVLSIDGLTEGTHFKSSWANVCAALGFSLGRGLGWKLMGSSLSDLAAMGSTRERWAMIYLAASGALKWDFLRDFQRGVNETARAYDCRIVGGDTVKARNLSMVAAVGGALQGRPLTRSQAKVGDLLCITGTVGDSSIGLNVLEKRLRLSKKIAGYFVRRFFEPQPLFKEGAVLAKANGITSLIDLSDAVKDTVQIISEMSDVGAHVHVDQIPVSSLYRQNFEKDGRLLTGGEDYSLMFTLNPHSYFQLRRRLAFSVIGDILPAPRGITFSLLGTKMTPPVSFQHFK